MTATGNWDRIWLGMSLDAYKINKNNKHIVSLLQCRTFRII
jgi:hypothetical protein